MPMEEEELVNKMVVNVLSLQSVEWCDPYPISLDTDVMDEPEDLAQKTERYGNSIHEIITNLDPILE